MITQIESLIHMYLFFFPMKLSHYYIHSAVIIIIVIVVQCDVLIIGLLIRKHGSIDDRRNTPEFVDQFVEFGFGNFRRPIKAKIEFVDLFIILENIIRWIFFFFVLFASSSMRLRNEVAIIRRSRLRTDRLPLA